VAIQGSENLGPRPIIADTFSITRVGTRDVNYNQDLVAQLVAVGPTDGPFDLQVPGVLDASGLPGMCRL